MAVVERLRPRAPDVDERLFARAIRPGRIRGVATDLIGAMIERPRDADRIVREGLRAARQLHSAERRLVGDGIYAWMRHGAWLRAATGSDAPETAFLGWLALAAPVDGIALTEPAGPAGDLSPESVAFWGNLDRALAAALIASVPDPVAFLAASNDRAPFTLRANRLRNTRERLAERLAADGIATRPGALAPDALIAERSFDVHANGPWRDGAFEVQDEGSQLVIDYGEPRGALLDLCAGAGGKALHAASVGAGPITASDTRPRALSELSRRAARAGASIRVGPPEPADTVLVDAPCSGTGTLRRHPELRLRLDAAALASFPPLQSRLLAQGASFVRPGGRLIYATCSVLRSENEDVVDAFLAASASSSDPWRRAKPDRRVAPDTDGCDGLFVAVLDR